MQGDDILNGGAGEDIISGGAGADTFMFTSNEDSVDFITDFSISDGDKIDISDILSGYDPLADAITDFVQITDDGTNSFLAIDADGMTNGTNFIQIAQINYITGLTDEQALVNSGNLIVA